MVGWQKAGSYGSEILLIIRHERESPALKSRAAFEKCQQKIYKMALNAATFCAVDVVMFTSFSDVNYWSGRERSALMKKSNQTLTKQNFRSNRVGGQVITSRRYVYTTYRDSPSHSTMPSSRGRKSLIKMASTHEWHRRVFQRENVKTQLNTSVRPVEVNLRFAVHFALEFFARFF